MRKDGKGQQSFASIDEGIYALASLLRRAYISQGLTSIEQIQQKYAPVGAGNDPRGLNNYWVSGVRGYYKKLSR